MVLSGERVIDQVFGPDLNLTDFLEDFFGDLGCFFFFHGWWGMIFLDGYFDNDRGECLLFF